MPASFCAALTTPPSPCTIIFTSLNFFGKHKTLIFYPNVCHCHAQSRLCSWLWVLSSWRLAVLHGRALHADCCSASVLLSLKAHFKGLKFS